MHPLSCEQGFAKDFMETRGLQVSHSVRSTDTQDGVVLLDVHGGMCFPLDQVGTLIWKRLEQRLAIDDIAQEIANTYRIPFELASADTREFVQELRAKHLLLDEESKEESGALPWTAPFGHLCRWLARQRKITRGA